jgi:hypothetical protein
VVSAELARTLRKSRQLQALLKLAVQAEEDRNYIRALTGEGPHEPAAKGVAK